MEDEMAEKAVSDDNGQHNVGESLGGNTEPEETPITSHSPQREVNRVIYCYPCIMADKRAIGQPGFLEDYGVVLQLTSSDDECDYYRCPVCSDITSLPAAN